MEQCASGLVSEKPMKTIKQEAVCRDIDGKTAKDADLYVTRPSMPSLDEYVTEISSLWNTRMLTNMAEKHEQFGRSLEKYLHVENCVLFANGHSALQASLEAFGLEGEVITTPFTFPSTTHAIMQSGLKPVMCDVKASDGTLDPSLVEQLVTDRTCAVLPVHVYGNPCDVREIDRIAQSHDLKVLYDAAHAFGELVDDCSIATFGDASVFSFHATKVFNSVEGGAVCFNGNESLRRKLELLRNFGIVDEEHVDEVGFNAKMSELHAAMGLCNLRHHDGQIALRRHVVRHYRERLEKVDGLRFLSQSECDEDSLSGCLSSNYAYCALVVEPEFGIARNELHAILAEQGVFTRKYFYPCTNAYACYEGILDPAETPVAKMLSERVICLPLFAGMNEREVDRVCDALLEARRRPAMRGRNGGTP